MMKKHNTPTSRSVPFLMFLTIGLVSVFVIGGCGSAELSTETDAGSSAETDAGSSANANNVAPDCPSVKPNLCEAPAGSSCYYINPVSGNDNASGTYSKPWRTLRNVNVSPYYRPATRIQLQPGDHVYLMGGVYGEIYHPGDDSGPNGGGNYILYLRGLKGAADKPIVFKGYPRQRPIFDTGNTGRGIYLQASSYIDLEGIEIRNAHYRGIWVNESDHVNVKRVLIHNTDGTVSDNVAGMELLNSSSVEVSESVFYDNYDRAAAAAGKQTWNSGNFVLFGGANIEVHHSIFYMTGDRTGPSSGFGIKYKHCSRNPKGWFRLHDNYFENHKYFAIGLGTAHAHVHHNIVNGAPFAIADQDHGGPTHLSDQVFEYNTIFNSRGLSFSPTLAWQNHEGGPWTELVDIHFRNNIVVDNTTSPNIDTRTILLDAYMNDALFLRLRGGISFNNNCYFGKNAAVSFGFAEATSRGAQGGAFNLSGWQKTYGYDLSSVEGNPGLTNPTALDFTLAAGSTCAGRGALTDGHSPPFDKEMVFTCVSP